MSNMLAPLQQPIQLAKSALYALPAPPVLRSFAEMAFRVVRNFTRDDGPHMAAGVAYYATFSLFPLVLGVIAIAGFFVDTTDVEQEVLHFLDVQLPGIGGKEVIASNIASLVDLRGTLSAISIAFLFWSGRGVFGAVYRITNRAWHVRRRPKFVVFQLSQVFAAAIFGAAFLITIALGAVGHAIAEHTDAALGAELPWAPVLGPVPLIMSTSMFVLIYRFVPEAEVRWRDAILGTVFASSMFELTKVAFAAYLGNLPGLDLIYGSVTTMIALMLFLYVSAIVLAIGAELSSEYNTSCRKGLVTIRGHLRPIRGGLAPAADQ